MSKTNDLNNSATPRSKADLNPTDLLRYALVMDDEDVKNSYYKGVEILDDRKNLIKEALALGAAPNVDVDAGTALMWAKDVEEMKLLLEAGADVNARGCNNVTALIGVDKEKTEFLLANGADANAKDAFGKTALMDACARGDIETVKVLIEAGADYNAKDKDGNTVIDYAKTPEAKEGFLKALSTCNWGKCGTTALCHAVINNDLKEVQSLLAMGVDSNAFDSGDGSALMYANTEEMANLLIATGADFNAENRWGYTALQDACKYGRTGAVKAFLEAGAHVDGLAVSNACEEYHIETLKLLVEVGGYSPTMALRSAKTAEMVNFLFKAGADVNAKYDDGKTPLMCACALRHAKANETVEALLKSGAFASINAKDNDGRTALMFACMGYNTDTIGLLVDVGADVNAKDNYGKTALMYTYPEDIREFLIGSGADVFVKDKEGKKASDYHSCSEIIRKTEKAQFLADKRHKLADKIGLGDVKLPETVKKVERKVSKVVTDIRDIVQR